MRKTVVSLLAVLLALALPACRKKEAAPDPNRLVADLKSPDAEKSGQARLELIRMGEPAVPAVSGMLRSGTPAERIAAANTLWGMGARARAAAPDLAAALADPDPDLQVAAAMALENMGPAAAPAVAALIRALRDPSAEVRPWAARALGSIGSAAESAVPALERAARQDGVQGPAEEAIRKIRAR
jgi:HEAT repeat protein